MNGDTVVGYAIVFVAVNRDGMSSTMQMFSTRARSREEAIGTGMMTARDEFPEKRGWYRWDAMAMAITFDMIKDAALPLAEQMLAEQMSGSDDGRGVPKGLLREPPC